LKLEEKKTEAAGLSLDLRTRSTKIIWSRCKCIEEKPTRRARQALVSTLQELRWHNIHWSSTNCRYVWCKGKYVQVILLQVGSCIFIGTYRTGRCIVHVVQWHRAQRQRAGRLLCAVRCVLIDNWVKCIHWRHAQFTEVESK
jgi:hypothetical protein